jgi:hypothetical protein
MHARAHVLGLIAAGLWLAACGGEFGGDASGSQSGPTQLLSSAASAGGSQAFEATVYPILRTNCEECHAGAGPGSPHIASPNVQSAYLNVVNQGKVDLAVPESSRLVQKVEGGHNCWDPAVPVPGEDRCVTNANEILAAIVEWADLIDFGSGGVSIDETLASSTLSLSDGVEDVGLERYDDTVIALYEFQEGAGTVAYDTSEVLPANDLDLEGAYEWMSAWGVQFSGGRALGRASHKLYDHIADPALGTGQYSVELWITNANVTQSGPARIVTYSRNENSRNFTLGQVLYTYDFRNRALLTGVSGNGTPSLVTYDADEDAQDRLQHVVITYDQFRGRRIYVDGVFTDDVDEMGPGRLWNWERDASYVFGLADEVNQEDRHWEGQIRLVAVYDSALTQAQIDQNYQAGVGRRLLMRFDVSRWTTPASAIEFEVSEFDNYSYLFCTPTYETANPSELRLANIRIAVNGEIPTTGQGFRTLDTQVTSDHQELSRQCSVIPKGSGGPASDEFTLVFEHLGPYQNLVEEPLPGPAGVVIDPSPRPVRGLRDFARANQTMAEVTGVDPGAPGPRDAYLALQQQLPGGFDLRTFVSAHQVGIAKLALEYCDALVEDVAARDAFFGAFPFGGVPESVFVAAGNRQLLSDALYDGMLGDGLSEQPARQDVRNHLDTLYDALLLECTPTTPCDAERTETMVKAACAAVLSSAAVSVH